MKSCLQIIPLYLFSFFLLSTPIISYGQTPDETPRVDIIISTDTYVPIFYKGRTLPASQSNITATALVFENGQQTTDDYIYIWNNDGERKSVNRNKVVFTPNFESSMSVSVTVLNINGSTVAEKTIFVPIMESEVYIYSKNPLRGISSFALSSPYYFLGEEITLRAEPFYIENSIQNLQTTWKIDGRKTANYNDPLDITIEKSAKTGSVSVDFEIINTSILLQGASSNINLKF